MTRKRSTSPAVEASNKVEEKKEAVPEESSFIALIKKQAQNL